MVNITWLVWISAVPLYCVLWFWKNRTSAWEWYLAAQEIENFCVAIDKVQDCLANMPLLWPGGATFRTQRGSYIHCARSTFGFFAIASCASHYCGFGDLNVPSRNHPFIINSLLLRMFLLVLTGTEMLDHIRIKRIHSRAKYEWIMNKTMWVDLIHIHSKTKTEIIVFKINL